MKRRIRPALLFLSLRSKPPAILAAPETDEHLIQRAQRVSGFALTYAA